jgi:hypothetical protein
MVDDGVGTYAGLLTLYVTASSFILRCYRSCDLHTTSTLVLVSQSPNV